MDGLSVTHVFSETIRFGYYLNANDRRKHACLVPSHSVYHAQTLFFFEYNMSIFHLTNGKEEKWCLCILYISVAVLPELSHNNF
jgi:hypothetical protein